MQDLKPLRVFLEVAAQRSFAGAARSLGMTPATVTRLVAALEADLGQQLLLRTTRQVSLTSAGAVALARYRPMIADFDRVTEEITRATHPGRGRLAINAPVSFGQRLLPPILAAFRDAYPEVALDIRLTDTLVDIIETGCDLAIRVSGPPADKSTIWRKICEVPRYTIAAPNLFATLPDTPDDLDPNACLSYGADGVAETWQFSKGAARRSIRASAGLISNNGDLLYALAREGAGVALLPAFIAERGLSQGEVIRVLPSWKNTALWLTLYYPPYERLPPLVATFSDFFETAVRKAMTADPSP